MALPGLDQFSWKSRTVELIPDSDAWRPEKERDILAGFYALGHELKGRGAFVSFVELPEYNGVKCGLDDFIVRAGAFPFETFQGCKRYALDHPRFKALSAWHQKWERLEQRVSRNRKFHPSILRLDIHRYRLHVCRSGRQRAIQILVVFANIRVVFA